MHGFTGSSQAWGPAIIDGLASTGNAPALVDLPGHGRHAAMSDPEEFTLDAALAHIAGAGDWPTDLIAYSMGGRLALHFALRHPERVRRLVLESTSPGLASESERAGRRVSDERIAARIERDGVPAFVAWWEARPIFSTLSRVDPAARASRTAERLRCRERGLAETLRGLGTGSLPSLWERLDELTVPTLILAGAEDRKFVEISVRMTERLPRARAVIVEGAGHAVHLEQPAAWLDAVGAFLGEE